MKIMYQSLPIYSCSLEVCYKILWNTYNTALNQIPLIGIVYHDRRHFRKPSGQSVFWDQTLIMIKRNGFWLVRRRSSDKPCNVACAHFPHVNHEIALCNRQLWKFGINSKSILRKVKGGWSLNGSCTEMIYGHLEREHPRTTVATQVHFKGSKVLLNCKR